MAAPSELAPAPAAPVPAAVPRERGERPPRPTRRPRLAGTWQHTWWLALLVAGACCWVTFEATGGLNLHTMTTAELALTLGAGVLVAACVMLAPAGRRVHGLWPAGLLFAFAMLTALSVVWSVQPDHSWQDSGRMLAYAGVFAAGLALAHVAPARWPAVLGGLALAAVIVCGYALLTKVFPGLVPSDAFARLNEPYGYWNAVGLSAAMGVICCVWLGARRDGHALARALAYPAVGLLLVTLALAYSRGALAALAIGLVLWLCMVPLRLRSAALLIVAGVGAAAVVGWDFSRHALSSEGVPIAERAAAGHELGALLVAMLAVLALAGIAIGFLTARRPPAPRTRARAGRILLAGVALVLLAFAGALAHTHRGLVGTVSHDLHALTSPNAKPPPNTPGRLTAVASVRARYWKEALQVFQAHPLLGVGAEGFATAHLRYETQTLEVRHAHGFVVQTLADLGLVGLALALALLVAWMVAAGRSTHPFDRRWSAWRWRRLHAGELTRYTPERVGMLAMLCLVVTFGAHSFVDWTWYVPGDACVALVCAGWLAGRGPLVRADTGGPHLPASAPGGRYARPALAALALVAALLAAWSQWQPRRSEAASQQALALLAANRQDPSRALGAADAAVSDDPLSVEALIALSTVQQAAGTPQLARATLERAVRLQPTNPEAWLVLGRDELTSDPAAAAKALQAEIYLDPQSVSPEAIAYGEPKPIEIHNDYIQALAAQARQQSAGPAAGAAAHLARLKSVSGSRSPATPGAPPAGQPPGGSRSTRNRTGPAAP